MNKSEEACRQLLRQARQHVVTEKRAFRPSRDQHLRALRALVDAASDGNVDALMEILAPDAVLVADAGPTDRTFGGARKVGAPVVGAAKVAAFTASITPKGADGLTTRECEINGQAALLVLRDGEPFSAIVLALENDRIRSDFVHSDPAKLRRVR